jgi:hypothetical protein
MRGFASCGNEKLADDFASVFDGTAGEIDQEEKRILVSVRQYL